MVDKAALDEVSFKMQGGFARINKVFQGKLEQLLSEISQSLWEDSI